MASATLGQLADRFGCEYRGDSRRVVTRVGTLSAADESSISFLANPKFTSQLADTRAGIVIVDASRVADCPVDCLIHANPYATFARIAAFLHPAPRMKPGIAESATVSDGAQVASSSSIGANVVIESGASIGERASLGPGCVVGANSRIGDDTMLAASVVVAKDVEIGRRCTIHPGAVIGADGFGFAPDDGTWVKVPQLGGVVIGDDVEIGANTTIDRGTIENTVIEDGVKLDNLVQIAHNARIGAHTVMAAMSGVAGSTRVGQRCMIGGGTVLINHLEICDDAVLLFRSVITKSVTEPGVYSGSLPAEEAATWRRNAARFRQLDKLAERLRRLEQMLRMQASEPDQDKRRITKDD